MALPPQFLDELRARTPLPAVIGRIENGRLLLDLSAVPPADDEQLAAAVIAAAR